MVSQALVHCGFIALLQVLYLLIGGNLSSKIAQNKTDGKFFSEDELKQLLRHVALVMILCAECLCILYSSFRVPRVHAEEVGQDL